MGILGRSAFDTTSSSPDRVHYTTGMLLDREDFRAEQSYHRGRLARSLLALHGTGTIGGLQVSTETVVVEEDGAPIDELRLLVTAGLAIDPLGRLIELPVRHCLRIDRWWQAIAAEAQGRDTLRAAFVEADGVLQADVFISFDACERGLRPSFSEGTVDALDAVQASRLRDGAQIDLLLRQEADPGLPATDLPARSGDADTDASALQQAKLDRAFADLAPTPEADGRLPLGPEHLATQSGSELWLARLRIPFSFGPDPARVDDPITIDNRSRHFVYAGRELAWLQGL